MKLSGLLRLGLFQMAAGATSVIFLGVVNRVMRVELGIDLFLVSLLVGGGHYLGAVAAIPFGHFSDTHPLAGYRRTWYALGGTLVTAAILALSPWMAVWISNHANPLGIAVGFAFFLLEGISTFIAGTAYLSLITDITSDKERGQATGLVWTMLMVGIIATGIGAGIVLRDYTFDAFALLTAVAGAVAVLLSVVALLGQERRQWTRATVAARIGLRQSLSVITHSTQARWFAAFLMLSMFSYFMQDVILEPFGGEVFGMSAAHTTRFNAYMGLGVILGMISGGMWLIPRYGKPRITAVGCWLQALAFTGLSAAALTVQSHWLPLAITLLGLGAGFFTVGGVSMMMDMTSSERTGLFVGAWTLVQAMAKGPAAIAGGALQSLFEWLGTNSAQAYGAVFAVEGFGILLSILFLTRVGVLAFRREVETFGTVAAEAMD